MFLRFLLSVLALVALLVASCGGGFDQARFDARVLQVGTRMAECAATAPTPKDASGFARRRLALADAVRLFDAFETEHSSDNEYDASAMLDLGMGGDDLDDEERAWLLARPELQECLETLRRAHASHEPIEAAAAARAVLVSLSGPYDVAHLFLVSALAKARASTDSDAARAALVDLEIAAQIAVDVAHSNDLVDVALASIIGELEGAEFVLQEVVGRTTSVERAPLVAVLDELVEHVGSTERRYAARMLENFTGLRNALIAATEGGGVSSTAGGPVGLGDWLYVTEHVLTRDLHVRGALALDAAGARTRLVELDERARIMHEHVHPFTTVTTVDDFDLVLARAIRCRLLSSLAADEGGVEGGEVRFDVVGFPGGTIEISGASVERRARWVAQDPSLAFAECVVPEVP